MAKTVAKISVISNTAGGKKSLARRSTGLDDSSFKSRHLEHMESRDPGLATRQPGPAQEH
jgi:hypothetical protein